MHPNWLGVFSVALAFVAFLMVHRAAKNSPVSKRILFALLAILAALPAAGFSAYYAHVIPETAWYYQFRSITGTELLVLFLGAAGGLVATLLPRALLTLPLLGVAACSMLPFIKPFIAPIPEPLKNKWSDGICLQSSGSTCGAASTATILKHLGGDVTEPELAAEAHSYAGGTEAWYLARAVRSRGYDASFVFSSGFAPEAELPAMFGVLLGSMGHFIPILGREGELYIVGDPLHGREWLSQEQLTQRYKFTGFRLQISKLADRDRLIIDD